MAFLCRVYPQKLSIWKTGIFGNFSVGGGNFVISKREFPVALDPTDFFPKTKVSEKFHYVSVLIG